LVWASQLRIAEGVVLVPSKLSGLQGFPDILGVGQGCSSVKETRRLDRRLPDTCRVGIGSGCDAQGGNRDRVCFRGTKLLSRYGSDSMAADWSVKSGKTAKVPDSRSVKIRAKPREFPISDRGTRCGVCVCGVGVCGVYSSCIGQPQFK
jgi:hypothetical protein